MWSQTAWAAGGTRVQCVGFEVAPPPVPPPSPPYADMCECSTVALASDYAGANALVVNTEYRVISPDPGHALNGGRPVLASLWTSPTLYLYVQLNSAPLRWLVSASPLSLGGVYLQSGSAGRSGCPDNATGWQVCSRDDRPCRRAPPSPPRPLIAVASLPSARPPLGVW